MPKNKTEPHSLGQNIRNIMNERGLKIAEVARESGLTFNSLRYILCGVTKNPAPDKLQKIADFFGVSIEYLMGTEKLAQTKKAATTNKPTKSQCSTTLVPVLAWNEVKQWCGSVKSRSTIKPKKYISTELKISPNAFALVIQYEARGVIPSGTLALIDPDIKPEENRYVIASINKLKPCIKLVCKDRNKALLNGVGYNVPSEKLELPNIALGTIVETRQNYLEK